ncbi:MAG: RIP metalloprotease RseP [Gemmatimonadales bacterium]|nr:RIP metalloprotease RseP [Gemmatimonadales bacterium]
MNALLSLAQTLVALAVVLGVLIFVHEAGHFIAAKWAGIYVHRFSLGLGAPIKALTRTRGETEYSISWLPLGGYVKMASREEDATTSALEGGTPVAAVPAHRMFEAQPVWKRMIVILAGVTMNILFALLLFTGLALWKGEQVLVETRVGRVQGSLPAGAEGLATLQPGDRITAVGGARVAAWHEIGEGISDARADTVTLETGDGRTIMLPIHHDAMKERLQAAQALQPFLAPVVRQVVPGQPASRADIQAGDTVVAIDGHQVTQWYDVTGLVEPRVDTIVTLTLARGARRLDVAVRTVADSAPDITGRVRPVGRLGIAGGLGEVRTRAHGLTGSIVEGARRTLYASTQVARTLKGLINGRVAGKELGGPILIGQLAGQTARLGAEAFLSFMGLISVNLAILNLLPIPVLDGGQFMFLLGEAALRRPLPLKLRERLTLAGMAFLLLVMVFAFWNDFRRLFEAWQHR